MAHTSVTPAPEIAAAVRNLVAATSLTQAAARLKIANTTAAKIAGGLGVSAGSLALVALSLRQIEEGRL